ncbi:hypothetical protein LPTSP4_27470 [Leptospira ryugenii]|uniref:Lipoprotein n=1 Tax=Leptospira ryugenii TaxID=1917863 RepID=A0A2P2E2U3_9LEPT|nr:hypothetical protein [Leptospira ryugenii]GBF51215.1 hypothetical protein LPTSP4_27470 [Leptospira ryugenii]
MKNLRRIVFHIINFFLLLYTFGSLFIGCVKNEELKGSDLVSQRDADRDYSRIFILKSLESFPNDAIPYPISFEPSERCDRKINYKKKDFQVCLGALLANRFSVKNQTELSIAFQDFVDRFCKLKKVIFLENSLTSGEINLCEINY